jgi:hypothetical protein
MGLLTIENRAGTPVQAGERRITPFVQVVSLQIPGLKGGLIWNRPHAVLVQEPDGTETVLPVPDITRLLQIFLLAAGLFAGLLFWMRRRG